jgi:hypothetical protein
LILLFDVAPGVLYTTSGFFVASPFFSTTGDLVEALCSCFGLEFNEFGSGCDGLFCFCRSSRFAFSISGTVEVVVSVGLYGLDFFSSSIISHP